MKIGLPKEIKDQEFRVGLTPASVKALCQQGHEVFVETGAGEGAGFTDDDYQVVGGTLVADGKTAWSQDLVVKVKEPQPSEYQYFREDLLLFTYLHLAAERELTAALMKSGISAIAYETVMTADGKLPLLTPMSIIAGRLSVQFGARYLEKQQGGRGVLLGGRPRCFARASDHFGRRHRGHRSGPHRCGHGGASANSRHQRRSPLLPGNPLWLTSGTALQHSGGDRTGRAQCGFGDWSGARSWSESPDPGGPRAGGANASWLGDH